MANDTNTQTVTVLAWRLAEATAALDKLVRKGARYGQELAYTVGEVYTQKRARQGWDGETITYTEHLVDLQLTGPAPRYGNHELLAHIELTPAGCIVDVVPGVTDLDVRFRHTDGHCDHCNTTRARADVYALRNVDTGAQVQVGRSCLRDYLGIDDPAKVARRFATWAEGRDLEDEFGAGRPYWAASVLELLEVASVAIQLWGWCSKAMAANGGLTATAAYVVLPWATWTLNKDDRATLDAMRQAAGPANKAEAGAVLAWVRSQDAGSEYMHNLVTLCAEETLYDPKRIGLVISAVAAYHRAQGRDIRNLQEKATSAWQGTVGERLRDLELEVMDSRSIESDWGSMVLYKLQDAAGNLYSWFASNGGLRIGDKVKLTGTVKKHAEFKGVRETQLTRCKVA